jgi:hypothetical protein
MKVKLAMKTYKSKKSLARLRVYKSMTRSKAEIVNRAEALLGPFIFDSGDGFSSPM